MLKTGLKSFVYSFSVSLFTIVSVNRAFFYEKKQQPSGFDIQNKSIALYLADIKPSYVPVKKIALNSLPLIQKEETTPQKTPEVIMASTLEPADIPLEVINTPSTTTEKNEKATPEKQEIALADVLYAPNKPLPIPEIEAEPIYQPETSLEIKIASAPIYNPEKETDIGISSPPPAEAVKKEEVKKEEVKKEQKQDDSLRIARNDTIGTIPISTTINNNPPIKVQIGNTKDLQHIAFADKNAPIQSMTDKKIADETDKTDNGEWNYLEKSPWVVAKSTGGKNLFAKNQAKKELDELAPLKNNKKGVLLASETPKNLIIPIPEEILNKKDITPQLAYPITSEDKQKEIDINSKIKEAEKKEKLLKEEKNKASTGIITPIDEDIDLTLIKKTSEQTDETTLKNKESETASAQKNNLMGAINSIFNKTVKTVSDTKDKVLEKAKSSKKSLRKRVANQKPVTIMPTEIRLSFQPNKAEISGQTLKWIQAFAVKTAQTSGLTLEIRIDGTSSTKLQQKRLNLLYNILTNKGVDYSMINTVFTTRDPNSFILRTVAQKNNKQGVNNQKTNRYIQW